MSYYYFLSIQSIFTHYKLLTYTSVGIAAAPLTSSADAIHHRVFHQYYTLNLSEPCPWVKKKVFQEMLQFYTFPPKITSPWGRGSWNLQFLVSLPYGCYMPNLVKIGPVVLEKKMLTDEEPRTTHDDGRQPIAIGHLSDSGDLKTWISFICGQMGRLLRKKLQRDKQIDRQLIRQVRLFKWANICVNSHCIQVSNVNILLQNLPKKKTCYTSTLNKISANPRCKLQSIYSLQKVIQKLNWLQLILPFLL